MNTSTKAVAVAVRNESIYAAAQAVKGVIADDHRNDGTIKLWGLATLVKEEKAIVVALCDSAYFCVNRVYLGEEKEARVSRDSVGGVVHPRNHATMEEAIEAYNLDQKDFIFTTGQLTNVVKF